MWHKELLVNTQWRVPVFKVCNEDQKDNGGKEEPSPEQPILDIHEFSPHFNGSWLELLKRVTTTRNYSNDSEGYTMVTLGVSMMPARGPQTIYS